MELVGWGNEPVPWLVGRNFPVFNTWAYPHVSSEYVVAPWFSLGEAMRPLVGLALSFTFWEWQSPPDFS